MVSKAGSSKARQQEVSEGGQGQGKAKAVSKQAATSSARVSVRVSSRVAKPADKADRTAIVSVLVNRAFIDPAIAFRTRVQ